MADDVVYLDYAATSAVRPARWRRPSPRYLRDVGATPGARGTGARWRRGASPSAAAARSPRLFNAPGDPGRITFHLNATHALNVALLGVLRPGDRVVRTAYDHNAVRRPVPRWPRAGGGDGARGNPGRRSTWTRRSARCGARACW
jgi:cysteine desulfurase/selenocysteine lyase